MEMSTTAICKLLACCFPKSNREFAMKLKFIFFCTTMVACMIGMTGCPSKTRLSSFVPLNDEMGNTINSTQGYLFTGYGQVYTDFVASGAGMVFVNSGGTIIPVYYQYGGSKIKRPKNIEHMADKFSKDLGSEFQKAVSTQLSKIQWLKLKGVNLIYSERKKVDLDEKLKGIESTHNLFLDTSYNFSSDFNMFVLRCNLGLVPNLNSPTSKMNVAKDKNIGEYVIYKNNFLFKVELGKSALSEEKALALWLENEGELLKLAMREGIKAVSSIMTDALKEPGKRVKTSQYYSIDYHGKRLEVPY
jgi:hypothetical protein